MTEVIAGAILVIVIFFGLEQQKKLKDLEKRVNDLEQKKGFE